MKKLTMTVLCLVFSAGGAGASGMNGEESFVNSLAPSALAAVELPREAQPVTPSILPLPRDPFSYLSECRVVDAELAVQPSIPEGVELLAGCMRQVSRQYKVAVKANVIAAPWGGPGGGPQGSSLVGISLSVTGKVPAGNPVADHLAYSLKIRDNRLFGHAARVSAAQAAKRAAQGSSTWVSLRLFTFKSGALEFAGKVKEAFERAGVPVIGVGTYSSFESTGFKNKATVTYSGDDSVIGSYKSPWYRTELERDAALAEIDAQLARQGNIVIDRLLFREGDGVGPMAYVFTVDYVKTAGR